MKLKDLKPVNEAFLTTAAQIKMRLMSEVGISMKTGSYEIVDGVVNVKGDVNIKSIWTDTLPFQFGVVTGNFSLTNCKIKNLKGCPSPIGREFTITDCNSLETLEGGPHHVFSLIIKVCKNLVTLEGAPQAIDYLVFIEHTKIRTLEGLNVLNELTHFNLESNEQLESLKGIPEVIKADLRINRMNPKMNSLLGIDKMLKKVGGNFAINGSLIYHGGLGLLNVKIGATDSRSGPMKIISKYLNDPEGIFDCQAELIAAGFERNAEL